jgi:hypothetical protein
MFQYIHENIFPDYKEHNGFEGRNTEILKYAIKKKFKININQCFRSIHNGGDMEKYIEIL